MYTHSYKRNIVTFGRETNMLLSNNLPFNEIKVFLKKKKFMYTHSYKRNIITASIERPTCYFQIIYHLTKSRVS